MEHEGTVGGDASPASTLQRTRSLVMRFGWNATAYQLINRGIAHWFTPAGDAVIGFVRCGGVRVVAGAPVCAAPRLAAVAREFEHDAHAAGDRVCYFGAGERLEERFAHDASHGAVSLGAQPSWDPVVWPEIMRHHASLRAQCHRARNKDVGIAEWTTARAEHEGAALRRCLDEWLATRPLPPLHFLVEPETLGRLYDRRLFVAEREGKGGERSPVGFLVASPIPARHGWLVEQVIRGRDAPNGTAELLIDAAMRALAASGSRYVTLGLAPLSRHSRSAVPPAPLWLRILLRWVRAHGRRFYNFEGLDRFKTKLDPENWEEILAIDDAPRFSPRSLWAIATAFGGRSPLTLLPLAVARAAAQEMRWITAG